ncbi:MAG: hypothetical protein AAFP69_23585 [Planctomycetota bacterium]
MALFFALIPTKVYEYDTEGRLSAVELPVLQSADQADVRPRYEYGYNSTGSQTLIRDPLGRETWFAFDDDGRQISRTLPIGFGPDGVRDTDDDAVLPEGDFTERFTYDSDGRQHTHTSFEGIVTENLYDEITGRLWAMNYYANADDFAAGLISQRDETSFDALGRTTSWTRYSAREPTALAAGLSASTSDAFTATRTEETHHDARGRITAEISPEGTLEYSYNTDGQRTATAIYPSGVDYQLTNPDRITHYGYDTFGRLQTVSEDSTPSNTADAFQVAARHTYDLAGRPDLFTRGNGATANKYIETDYEFDSLGRLDTLTDTAVDLSSDTPRNVGADVVVVVGGDVAGCIG